MMLPKPLWRQRMRWLNLVVLMTLLLQFAWPLSPVHADQPPANKIYLPIILHSFDARLERQTLLKNVARISIPAPAVPGPLALFEAQAFPVLIGRTGYGWLASVVAASSMGAGRVVVFGHTDFFSLPALNSADTGQFVVNAAQWTSQQSNPRIAIFQQNGLQSFLSQRGLPVQSVSAPITAEQLRGVQVLALDPSRLSSPAELEVVKAFIINGGGLLAAGLGWGWLQLNPGGSLASDHLGNRLLASAGLAWTDGYLSEREFKAQVELPPNLNSVEALNFLTTAQNNSANSAAIAQAKATVLLSIPALPEDNVSLRSLLQPYKALAASLVPTSSDPFMAAQKPLASLGLSLLLHDMLAQPADAVTAHPAGNNFPGAVPPDAGRIARTVMVDSSVPKWHSTGMYAAPGEQITIDLPAAAAATKKFMVRIGTHSDRLWNRDSWERIPQIDREFLLTTPRTTVANAFGGLIYIVVPEDSNLGVISVSISGGVAAPHFSLGQTDLTTWRNQIRYYPAPWAELESNNLILTIQSNYIRTLDDPQAVLQFWDRVQSANLDLAGWSPGRERPMRLTFDRQLSSASAYMHSGYPIMALLASQPNALNIVNVPAGVMPPDGWGFFHELGHNHQNPDWTFDGTVEVTVNLFTMYVIEQVLGLPKEQGLNEVAPDREVQVKNYFCSGASFNKWQSDPFLVLSMYVQMIDAFGWDSFKTVFREYLQLPSSERPQNDAQKRDQWLVRYSKTVGKNLGPFFNAWGIPTSAGARQSITNLPVWLPAPNFPANYACP